MTSSERDLARAPRPPERAPRRWGLRNWRVRGRLIALIAVPTVVAVALGAVGVGGALSGAAAYGRVGTLADVAGAVTASVGDLESEQADSAAFVGAGRPAARARSVADAQRRTDAGTGRLRALAATVDDGYPASTRDRVRRVLFRLDTLPALRSAVTTGRLPAGVTVDRYDRVVTDLLALDDEISQEGTDPDLSASVRALGALSRSRAALATQRALLESALLAGRFEPGGADALTRAVAAQDSALEQFRTAAPVGRTQAYDDAVAGADVDQTSAIRDGIAAGRPPVGGAAGAATWDAAATGTLTKVGGVESDLVAAISDRAGQLRSDQLRQALIVGIVALVVIMVVLLATIAVARSLVRPLRALRDGALSVAERRLPETVARLDREDPDTVDTRVEPIAVHTGDEIGEVARSFDAVHQEALRAAAGEARRRAQAGALFVTLSRRTQSLVDRQIELIDDLERGEEDADRLESLFRLDHLATRMRRNGENLLVLGGQEPVRRWNRRLGLLEVLRAALSEVEQYPRIDVGDVPDLTLAESAVSDVVHLLAELLDNATAFSSRTSRVDVAATALPDGSALVEITDRGIGLTAQECAELGKRLAAPGVVGVDASRRMGLYVVGRLAGRLGARVWLSPGSPRGVTASVTLPAAVLTEGVVDPVPTAEPAGHGRSAGSDGAWIGERFSRAIATPGPGADSWFGGSPLATAEQATGSPSAEAGSTTGAAAFVPTASGVTGAGLPRREPGANEVPGARPDHSPDDGGGWADGGWADGSTDDREPRAWPAAGAGGRHALADDRANAGSPDGPAADRSPEAIRSRYARYQRGRQQGRSGPEAPASTGSTAADGRRDDADATGPIDTGRIDTGAGRAATGSAGGTTGTPADTTGPIPTDAGSAAPTGAGSAAPTGAGSAAPTGAGSAAPTGAVDAPTEALPTTGPSATAAGVVAGGAALTGAAASGPGRDSGSGDADGSAGAETTDRPDDPRPVDDDRTAQLPVTTAPTTPAAGPAGPPGPPPEDPGATDTPGWAVPAPDVPWGAGPVREPKAAGSTTSGLPQRAPGANYVPGSVDDPPGDGPTAGDGTANGATAEPEGGRAEWDRSAEAIRRRFAAHQEGRRRGMERTGR